MKDANQLRNYIHKCVRCGQCRSVCPVFAILGEEGAAPRGKVFIASLLISGDYTYPGRAGYYLSLCLQCRRCSEQCPSGVPVHQIISRGRKLVSKPWQHLFYDHVLASSAMKTGAAKLFQAAENTGLKDLALKLGILPQWLNKVTLSKHNIIPEFTPSRGPFQGTVTYFPGCAATYIMPGIFKAAVRLLAEQGWDVTKPDNLTCCGFPHAAAGSDKAEELQEVNFKLLTEGKPDIIATSCPTCTKATRKTLESKQITIPVMEVTELLAPENLEFKKLTGPATKLAYHKPCHSSGTAPKDLLKLLPGFEMIPWEQEDICCGGGGTFMFQNPGLSMHILKPKVNTLIESGAEVVATNCPACIMQFQRGLEGTNINVMHPVEILARVLTGQPHE